MEYWNWHEAFESFFNVETVRTLDIFKINSSERWVKMLDNIDEFIWVLAVNAQINAVNVGEFFEKD